MKIYTKTGDKGMTSLMGGSRVPKHHLRIESYGTVDELNAHVGLLRDEKIDKNTLAMIQSIQDRLFTIGSTLAAEPKNAKMNLPKLKPSDIEQLEKEIDQMDSELPEMRSFVLPGGNQFVSYSHICRAICRRAERNIVYLADESEVDEIIIQYLNRLSDYFFTLSRKLTQHFGAEELKWVPKKD